MRAAIRFVLSDIFTTTSAAERQKLLHVSHLPPLGTTVSACRVVLMLS